MVDVWRRIDVRDIIIYVFSGYGYDNIRVVIVFFFFFILFWVGIILC